MFLLLPETIEFTVPDPARVIHGHAYSVGFADPGACAVFDAGLAELRRSGEYARIEQRYQNY